MEGESTAARALRATLAVGLLALGGVACGEPKDVGSVHVEASINTAPVLERIVPVPTRIDEGEQTEATAVAADPDGDDLTYAWSVDCEGELAEPEPGKATFTLTHLTQDTCTLQLELTDDRGAAVAGSVTITAGPPVGPDG